MQKNWPKKTPQKNMAEIEEPIDRTALNRASKELKQLLDKNINKSFASYIENLSATKDTEYSLWKAAKKLRKPKLSMPALNNADGKWARSDLDKAELFADHLSKVFTPHDDIPDGEVNAYLEAPLQMRLLIKPTSPSEVREAINRLRQKKALGYDLVTSELLKRLPSKGMVFLTTLFNAILRVHHYLKLCKVSQIIMVPKAGKNPDQISSYRPVSLLPAISKLFERFLAERIRPILEIPEHQFGFRQAHSTTQQAQNR